MRPVLPRDGRQEGKKLKVLCYVPNLLGYARILVLCLAAYFAAQHPVISYWGFFLNFVFDGVDGLVARRLNQVSLFGAFLDVIIDNAARGYLWILCAPQPFGFLMMYLEMLTFACTHASSSASWKDDMFASAPGWIKAIMADGFKTVPGIFVVYGLMGTPLWLFAQKYMPHSLFASPMLGFPAILGRLLGLVVEFWVIGKHIDGLLSGNSSSRGTLQVEVHANASED